MKKLIVVLIIALLPTLAFALDFQIGGTAMYKGMLSDIVDGPNGITLQDFTYGAEARLTFGLLQGAAAFLYYPSEPYDSLKLLADIGVTLNLAIVRLGVGIGPNFQIPLDGGSVDGLPLGLNLKGAVDLQLGKLSLGVVGYYYLDSFDDLNADLFNNAQPWVGLTLLYQLF
ncbi:MAG: hypothetical protein A2177_07800 [Spirochaetes bacterium RBG_13_68_11]|nr:MAG: hypothetical protein A2177_07800 [Spirochaetes bacterium RBG_13_68_11]